MNTIQQCWRGFGKTSFINDQAFMNSPWKEYLFSIEWLKQH